MKIRITNGYILPKMSLNELYDFIQEYRKKISVLSKKLIVERIGNMSMGYIDYLYLPEDRQKYFAEMYKYFYDNKNLESTPFFAAYEKMSQKEQQIKSENIKMPEYDYFCDLVFFPKEEHILVMIFAEQKSYVQLFENAPNVKPFFYWNNEEMPEGISDDEWARRESMWQEVLHTGVPALDGISASCYNYMPFITPEEVYEYIQDRFNMDVRTKNFASKIVVLRKYSEYLKQQNFPVGSKDMYESAVRYLKTKEGQQEFKKEVDLLFSVFEPEIEKKDLTTPFKELLKKKNNK